MKPSFLHLCPSHPESPLITGAEGGMGKGHVCIIKDVTEGIRREVGSSRTTDGEVVEPAGTTAPATA